MNSITDTLNSLRDAVCSDLYDWETRLVLADLFEELGDSVSAQGQRWQATYQKRPLVSFNELVWWSDNDRHASSIGPELRIFMNHPPDPYSSCRHVYSAVKQAEDDLAQAVEKYKNINGNLPKCNRRSLTT